MDYSKMHNIEKLTEIITGTIQKLTWTPAIISGIPIIISVILVSFWVVAVIICSFFSAELTEIITRMAENIEIMAGTTEIRTVNK